MGSSKKETNTTQTTTAAPWAQPYINDSLTGLSSASQQSQANAGAVQPYLMSAIQQLGSTPGYLSAAQNYNTNTLNGQNTNPYTSQISGLSGSTNPYGSSLANYGSSSAVTGLTNQQTNPFMTSLANVGSSPYVSQLANLDQSNPYISSLTNLGSNSYISGLTADNPYISQLKDLNSSTNPYAAGIADQLGQKTGANYAASFGTAGRANSGLAALLSTQGIGDTLNNFYSNQYATDQGYRNSALQLGANLLQQGRTSQAQLQDSQLGRDLSGLQSAGSLTDAQNGRNLQGLTSAAQLGVQGLQSAGQLQDSALARILSGQTTAAQLGLSGLQAGASTANDDLSRQLAALTNAGQFASGDLTRQQDSVGQASQLFNNQLAGNSNLAALSSLLTLLPLQGANSYAGGVSGLTAPYGTRDTNETQSTSGLGSFLAPALSLASLFGGGGALSGILGGGGLQTFNPGIGAITGAAAPTLQANASSLAKLGW